MIRKSLKLAALGTTLLGSFLIGTPSVEAAITAGGTLLNQTSSPAGLDGYLYYRLNNVSDLNTVPAYVSVVTNGVSRFSTASYSDLTIGVTTYDTGIGYHNTAVATPEIVTITVITAGSFQLGIFENNVDSANVPHDLNVTLNGLFQATQDPGTAQFVNNYYFFNVANASIGDVIRVVIPGSPNGNRGIGGLTFDNFAVPEPTGLSFLALGALMVARRKR